MGIGSEVYIITEVVVVEDGEAPEIILCKPYQHYDEARKEFDEVREELIREGKAYGYNIDDEPDYVIFTDDHGYYNCLEFKIANIH